MQHQKILILDFGAQYTQLIARRVREAKVYCEIHPCDVSDGFVREFGATGVILSGSHMSAYEESTGRAPQAAFQLGVPVLGIWHGMLKVWMSHGDKVVDMPAGFKLMASTEACPIAAMADEERRFYAVQFHPEVTHTRQGTKILQRFVRGICGFRGDWNMPDYVGEAVQQIRKTVGREEVIL